MTPLDSIVRFLFSMLLDGLWEGALIAFVAWLVLRAMRNTNATTRHTILTAALLAALVLPVATVYASMATPVSVRQTHTHAITRERAPRTRAPSTITSPTVTTPTVRRPSVALPRLFVEGIVAAWVIGALFVFVRLGASLLYLETLKHDALPVPLEYRAGLRRWATAAKGSREVRLCRSNSIVIPIAVGLFDAMILLPEHLLEELGPDDIDQIVVHELAHLRRADDWLNAVERIAQSLFFFNPGILWIIAQLDLEREVACDDWVLQQNDALPYATTLAKIVESAAWPYRAMSAPGAFVTRRAMSVRIERILSKHRDVRVRPSLAPTGIAVAALTALCIAAAFVSPSFAYTVTTAAAPAPVRIAVKRTLVPKRASALPVKVAIATVAPVATSHPTITARPQRPKPEQRDYVDDMAAAGYTGLTVDELVKLRAVGVDGAYIQDLENQGLRHPSVDDLVKLRAMDVSGDYVRAMRLHFGSAITADDIASARALGITGFYLDGLAREGYGNLDLDSARSLRALGVTPEYVDELRQAGYTNLAVDQLRQFRALGIDGNFIRLAAAHGFHNLTTDQLIKLKTSGILK